MPEINAATVAARSARRGRSHRPSRHDGEMVLDQRHLLLLHRRDHCHHDRSQILLAGTPRHGALSLLRATAPAARQRNAVRLAAGRRHGAGLLHCAAVVRRETVERETRRCAPPSYGTSSSWAPFSHCWAATTRAWNTPNCRCRCDILVVIAWIMFGVNIFGTIMTRKYQQMYVSLWYIMGTILWTAFVYITGQLRHRVYKRRQPGQSQLDVRTQRRGSDLYSDWSGTSLITSFRNRRKPRCTATGSP